jgi:tetratricopeptide (TPR) repeat protein
MSTESIYAKAHELQTQGKYGEAVALYKELVKQAQDPRFYIAYGVCLQALGHWQESVKQLQRGIDLKPHYCEGDARLFLAESLLQSGQRKKAIEQWKLVAAMEPEYPSYEAVPNEAKRKLGEHAA